MSLNSISSLFIAIAFLVACSSSPMKNRKEQQAKLVQTTKLYCEFLDNGVYHDIDVALNIEMAKRCDTDKPFTVTPFKTLSESNGIIYCCTLEKAPAAEKRTEAPAAEKKAEAPKADAPKKTTPDPDGLE
jgi:hypothetical protein